MVALDRIHVLNPRTRSKRGQEDFIRNIRDVGLKRPITVARKRGADGLTYDLVCGQGRLEAFRALGQSEIPARVIDASEAECLVMSLVENIARRQHRPIDLMREIGELRSRGHSVDGVARIIGAARTWVNSVVGLLERGEERLLSAVETGVIPISLAAEIALADNSQAQNLLLDAYNSGDLRGKKLAAARKMLEARQSAKIQTLAASKHGRSSNRRPISVKELMTVYQKQAEQQRLLVKKSQRTETQLIFTVQALKDLLADEAFRDLLAREGLDLMPRALAQRISGDLEHA
ncbi:ParB N-terminal domain-containing protein [Novosphingobium piscinae]|uniref:ParB N-terminal domain-containing protein n=2 Tax=Novosphingobium piscinae TaxID=1507448 RepID=A0A7X1KP79_9SPHN|nr:ParB N-terminal domain-containing protein [Novosphingobium piscinae]